MQSFCGATKRRCFWGGVSVLTILPGLLCLCTGCGTGDYEQKLMNRKVVSKFDDYTPAENVPGTKMSIRVPKTFTIYSKGEKVDSKRIEPGIIGMAWVKRTYENFQKNGEDEKAYYCCFGTQENTTLDAVTRQLRTECEKIKGNNIAGDWADFMATTPTNNESKWRKLRCTAPMEFICKDKAGKERKQSEQGILEIYLHEEGGVVAIIVCRFPSVVEKDINHDDVSRNIAGGAMIVK
jgi:hypothetical protein